MQIFINLKLTDNKWKDIYACIEAIKAYFKPKRNVVCEHYIFHTCLQNPDETVDEFLNCIRELLSFYQFGMLIEELICKKLMLGIRDQMTKLQLLKEDSLTLNKAIKVCHASEVANVQIKATKPSTSEVKG